MGSLLDMPYRSAPVEPSTLPICFEYKFRTRNKPDHDGKIGSCEQGHCSPGPGD